jgi:hypothetical protein
MLTYTRTYADVYTALLLRSATRCAAPPPGAAEQRRSARGRTYADVYTALLLLDALRLRLEQQSKGGARGGAGAGGPGGGARESKLVRRLNRVLI